MTFKPIYDLESLTEQQRQEYYQNACNHYGVPPELNALAFLWMDTGDSKRSLVLYAKKMATDIIRANKGISITKLTKDEGRGYVSWIAEGKDTTGRVEMAVGSASTEGLKGQHLASAVMLAQTRSTRRLTLQFVGGLLDESELNETTADINRAPASLASMATLPAPQPIVVPNAEAGKDVTEAVELYGSASELNPNRKKGFVNCFDATAQQILEEGLKSAKMRAPAPFSSGTITAQHIPGTEPIEPLVQIEPAEPKRRRRRTKAEMEAYKEQITKDLGPYTPFSETQLGKAIDSGDAGRIEAIVEAAGIEVETQSPIIPLAAIAAAPINLDYPTSEQEAEYRKRLQSWVDVLKTAGMTGGINWRLKRYTLAMFPDAVVDNGRLRLTSKQWDTLLADFDTKQHQLGPQALVAEINTIAEKA